MIDETTKDPKTTSPPDTSAKKPRARKTSSPTTKPKRPKSGALWTNAAGEHYMRISPGAHQRIVACQELMREGGFSEDAPIAAMSRQVDDAAQKLTAVVKGDLTRALEGLKGGVVEGA